MEALQVKNISKSFDGVKAVDALSFVLEKSTITALIGPNGAGKTVTFNLITGFEKPSSGNICLEGKEITGLPPNTICHLGCGRTFQNTKVFHQMTVLENVLLGIKYRKGSTLFGALFRTRAMLREEEENTIKALRLLALVGLEDKIGELAGSLSHGQRRLLELARTLGTESDFYLFDEPTAGIFPETIPRLLEIIRGLKTAGKTVLFIEHNMGVVMGTSDKVIVLDHGKKIAEGIPSDIEKNQTVLDAYMGRGRRVG